MTQPLYKKYGALHPDAGMAFTNTFGIAFWFPVNESYSVDIITTWVTPAGYDTFHRHSVRYTGSGRPYICKGPKRIYLEEVVRNV